MGARWFCTQRAESAVGSTKSSGRLLLGRLLFALLLRLWALRFDIPEGDAREEWIEFFEQASRATAPAPAPAPAQGYRVSDPGETVLDTSTLSNQNPCYPDQRRCFTHRRYAMMQIFSLKLGKISSSAGGGPVQIYGYMAARDTLDPLRNYVFNRSRDDPVALEPGALMEMAGPRRGIEMMCGVLIEHDMWIKNGAEAADGAQLIDGVIDFSELTTPAWPFPSRIDGAGACGRVASGRGRSQLAAHFSARRAPPRRGPALPWRC